MNFERTMIIGSPGSGKTTFALKLGDILGREVAHLDRLLWEKNWEMLNFEKRKEIHDKLINSDSWLIDGMWRSHVADRLERATGVIFLDYKRSVSLKRAILRFFKFRGKQRSDIAEGCLEKLDREFLKYIWNFNKEVRPFLYSLLEAAKDEVDIVVLKNPKEAEFYLENLKQNLK